MLTLMLLPRIAFSDPLLVSSATIMRTRSSENNECTKFLVACPESLICMWQSCRRPIARNTEFVKADIDPLRRLLETNKTQHSSCEQFLDIYTRYPNGKVLPPAT